METTHSSLKLSKFLHEKGFEKESYSYWYRVRCGWNVPLKNCIWEDWKIFRLEVLNEINTHLKCIDDMKNPFQEQEIPAYDILNDLCVKHGKELFGEKSCTSSDCRDCDSDCCLPKYKRVGSRVFMLMRNGKKQEAEDLIMKHAVFSGADKNPSQSKPSEELQEQSNTGK
jgi:hypothetical protein